MKIDKIIFSLCIVLASLFAEISAQGVVSGPKKKTKPKTSTQQTQKKSTLRKSVTISEPDGYINGHGYVDLGLPSSVKWATCNVGALSPSDVGKYFAYGDETGNICDYSYEFPEISIINTIHDIAKIQMGSPWRMPSVQELEELNKKCQWKIVEINGRRGYKVIGPNKHSIFLPFAGYRDSILGEIHETNNGTTEPIGYYWAGDHGEGKWGGLAMYEGKYGSSHFTNGFIKLDREGCSVRAVLY